METIKYLVKLTPHEKFFFGGEQTFGERLDKNDETDTNYLVKSNYFPQQTSILGLIRFQLLAHAGSKIFDNGSIQNANEACILIGESSFKIEKGFPIGKIHSISPVFICNTIDSKTNEFLFPANKEFQKYIKLTDDCKEELHEDPLLLVKGKNGVLYIDKYDAKYPLDDFLINKECKRYKYEEVFVEHKQVGIRKQYSGGTDDDAYYIQTFYKFKSNQIIGEINYSFAFIVELEKDIKFSSQQLVNLGGEQQTFKMEVIPDFKEEFDSLVPDYLPTHDYDKVVLVSDSYVKDNDIFNEALFAITDLVDFRFLDTKTRANQNYYNKPSKSKKYNLLKKGSVFYGDTSKISEHLKNDAFNKLGYNFYKQVKKS